MVSSRAEYAEDARLRLSFERMKFLWSGETLLSFLQRRQFNYEPLDETSKIQDRILAQVPKEKKFMISVILGIFCSVATAELVEKNLRAVLKPRILKEAVVVVAKKARQAQVWEGATNA